MAKELGKVFERSQEYAGTAINTGIILGTAALEQVTTIAAYRCPCVPLSRLANCSPQSSRTNCTAPLLNYGYGWSFVIAPAIGLFVFGLASNPRTWKTLTGVCAETGVFQRSALQIFWSFIVIMAKALIAPLTWCAVAMLDGKYYACAVTPLPYDVAGETPTYKSCEVVAKTKSPFSSDQYNTNRSFSQLVGWIGLGAGLVAGLIIYAVAQCAFPLSYYHAKYYKYYQSAERDEFDDEMRKKAQKDAEQNVLKFMEKPRQKSEWDKISTVYEFHRDKRNLALYSNLDEWVKKTKRGEERLLLLEEESGESGSLLGAEADADGRRIVDWRSASTNPGFGL